MHDRAFLFAAVALALATAACSKSDDAASTKTPSSAETDTDKPATGEAAEPPAPEKPKVELLETPIERRLHSDRVEASSFLWNDFNRFKENYHPLYLVDDDPSTAWVEGAAGSGEGEWARVHVSPVEEASAVRLRLRNGYQKSKSLFKKNARAKTVTITLIPTKVSAVFELKDEMDWQSIELVQPAGALEAIEVRVDAIYPGSKYADLCLSDLELFVTARTPENPDFEKKKLEAVGAWKAERIEAAKLFSTGAAKEMPIAGGYKVIEGKGVGGRQDGPTAVLPQVERMIGDAIAAGIGDRSMLDSSTAQAKAGFADWVPVEVSVKAGRQLPAIDGLYQPESWEMMSGGEVRRSAFAIPSPGKVEFLTSDRLSSFESTSKATVAQAIAAKERACKKEGGSHHFYFRPSSDLAAKDGVLRALLVVVCGQEEERDGYYTYSGFQLLSYDDSGHLRAIVAPNAVSTFEWSDGKISGGERVRRIWGAGYARDKMTVAQAETR